MKIKELLVTFRQTNDGPAGMVTEDEQRRLLGIARTAMECSLSGKPRPPLLEKTGRLAEPGGAFVTIRIAGQLRGCIGYIESGLPLAEAVAEVAVKAATEDPRFPPLTPGELEEAVLEVSLLSPLQPVKDIEDIRVGEHGLLIQMGRNRGLLLPQVAVEYGWNRQQFLENTARKAALPPAAWKSPEASLFMFSAEVCDEAHVR